MMRQLLLIVQLLLIGLVWSGVAARSLADYRIEPPAITLAGAKSAQAVVVVAVRGGQAIGDRTAQARFSVADPAIATVDASGVVRPVGDGQTQLTATLPDGKTATATVRVTQAKHSPPWSFVHHVQPILTRNGCNSGACHGALAGKGGFKLSLRGYDHDTDLFNITRQVQGRRLDPTEPSRSLLLQKATRTLPHGGGRRLEVDSEDYQILLQWIAAGAPGPQPGEPTLTRLEVLPSQATLAKGEQLRVLVRAHYSNGQVQDVTRWARFGSSEEQVVTVSDDGLVKVAGHGEGAVTVVFGNRVAIASVRVPYANTVPPAVYAMQPRGHLVDALVMRKLEQLNLPPSPPASDTEFIRRAYLDAIGVLPTPEELAAFLADPRPDKRAKLIDTLLERPEFVDYWAYKWSDLLLVSSRKLPQPAVWAFYRAIRQSVADNVPYDQFARQLLTARGSNLKDGLANYFVLHKDVAELTEATAVTFLGMSITCARCHNHPLERWTQDQYWSMASLFARVRHKNGERPGEVIVYPAPQGEIIHPRRGVPMPPAPLDGPALAPTDPTDRRAHFAQWLTRPDNPFFAKALVNRVWRNFMGRGLVEAEDDLRETNPPSNPELLDALCRDFIAHRYDLKHLIRTIMTSAAYQRSSQPVPGNEQDDRFYSRYIVRRLPAEVILDAYSQVTGVPTAFTEIAVGTTGGRAGTANYPLGTRALQLPDTQVISQFLDVFGRPERGQTCSCERQQDASVEQALQVFNGQTLNEKLRSKACRIEAWLNEGISDEQVVRRVYRLALCREPTAAELQRFLAIFAETPRQARREAIEDLFWAVLSGREFLFNR